MKETRILEYNAELTNSFLKTVRVFSNFGTGKILFGISDDGEILGMKNPDQCCLDIENKINDSIAPKPDYSLSINRLNNVAISQFMVDGTNFRIYNMNGCSKGGAKRGL